MAPRSNPGAITIYSLHMRDVLKLVLYPEIKPVAKTGGVG